MDEFDYFQALERDTLEQFRDKPKLKVLHDALARQLQEVYEFFLELKQRRDVYTATGAQLDGIGDIAVLTRKEAGLLTGSPIPIDVIDDETYRQYLIFKILKNTCDCTYPDIIKAFRMFWDKPLYYTEDPAQPATMIFDTGEMEGGVDTRPLFTTPLLRAAGVTLKLYARTRTEMDPAAVCVLTGLGCAVTVTELPELEREIDYGAGLHVGTAFSRTTEDALPTLERTLQLDVFARPGSVVYSVMETPIGDMTPQDKE